MIIVAPSSSEAFPTIPDTDAASTTTLVSPPRFPRAFPAFLYISIPLSIAAILCAMLDNSPIFAQRIVTHLFTILAFVCTLPYQLAALLLLWGARGAHNQNPPSTGMHGRCRIGPLLPASRGAIAYCALLALLWAGAAGSAGWVVASGFLVAPSPSAQGRQWRYRARRRAEAVAPLALALALLELVAFGAIVVLCYLHRRSSRRSEALVLRSAQITKVLSP